MKTTRRGILAAAAGGALASGCASIPLARAGSYQARGTAFSVTLARPWSDLTALSMQARGVRVLTINGLQLNQLYIASIAPNASLVRVADRDTPRPTYRTDMGETELVEFVVGQRQPRQAREMLDLRTRYRLRFCCHRAVLSHRGHNSLTSLGEHRS